MKIKLWTIAMAFALAAALPAQAAENYVIDTAKNHAFIQFKISHLGFSWMLGRFNNFEGSFSYDEQRPANNEVSVSIDMTSIDTNHAERDKHLRSQDFFDVTNFPKATFVSTGYEDKGNGKGVLSGKLQLHGVTKDVAIDVTQIGTGKDPWGGYRRGFEGKTILHLSDYNMLKGGMLGLVAEKVELFLSAEGVRQ
ncbi:MAG: YceI family protein [Mariprofundaceae bacterium]